MVSGAKGGGDAIWNYFFPSLKCPLIYQKISHCAYCVPGKGAEIQDKQIQDISNIIVLHLSTGI
jgi:hypothetical protein